MAKTTTATKTNTDLESAMTALIEVARKLGISVKVTFKNDKDSSNTAAA